MVDGVFWVVVGELLCSCFAKVFWVVSRELLWCSRCFLWYLGWLLRSCYGFALLWCSRIFWVVVRELLCSCYSVLGG